MQTTDLSWEKRVDLTRRLLRAWGESLAGRPHELETLVSRYRIAELNRAEAAKAATREVPARPAARRRVTLPPRRRVTLPPRLAALDPALRNVILQAVDDVIATILDPDDGPWEAAMDRFDAGVRTAAEGREQGRPT